MPNGFKSCSKSLKLNFPSSCSNSCFNILSCKEGYNNKALFNSIASSYLLAIPLSTYLISIP